MCSAVASHEEAGQKPDASRAVRITTHYYITIPSLEKKGEKGLHTAQSDFIFSRNRVVVWCAAEIGIVNPRS
jgi:hypothetical protein